MDRLEASVEEAVVALVQAAYLEPYSLPGRVDAVVAAGRRARRWRRWRGRWG